MYVVRDDVHRHTFVTSSTAICTQRADSNLVHRDDFVTPGTSLYVVPDDVQAAARRAPEPDFATGSQTKTIDDV